MKTCDTCKHWVRRSGILDDSIGDCSNAVTRNRWASDNRIVSDEYTIETRHKFGCIHHELPPAPTDTQFDAILGVLPTPTTTDQ